MPKKQTQRGCALSKKRRKHHNKSAKQRGGDLHKMYNINNLTTDPQRMMTVDRGVFQAGGKKHGHARKYLKHGGMNGSTLNNAVYNAMTPIVGSSSSVAVQKPVMI